MVNIRNLQKLNRLAGKAKTLAGQHNDKIDKAIDKGVQAAGKATKGKYDDKLAGGAEKLKGAVDKAAGRPAAPAGSSGTTAPPAAGPAAGTGPGAATPAGGVTPAPAPTPSTASAPVPDPDAPKGAS